MMLAGVRRLMLGAVVVTGLAGSAVTAQVLIHDAKSQPESLSVGPGGVLYVGSASSPFVYKVTAGAKTAETFVDATAEGPGTFFFGMLADGATNTLWTCQLTPVPNTRPAQRHTALRGFDLKTGTQKLRWDLPGDNTTCNDMTIGPDKALYISDTGTGKIYKLAPGATSAELFMEHRVLNGIDGLTFLDGVLYVNNVFFSKLYRIPFDAAGKPKNPEDIWMDAPVKGPDGMRAANGKIYVAANGGGMVASLTIDGDRAHVTVLKDGLKTPTAVEPAGDTLWIAERGAGMAVPVSLK